MGVRVWHKKPLKSRCWYYWYLLTRLVRPQSCDYLTVKYEKILLDTTWNTEQNINMRTVYIEIKSKLPVNHHRIEICSKILTRIKMSWNHILSSKIYFFVHNFNAFMKKNTLNCFFLFQRKSNSFLLNTDWPIKIRFISIFVLFIPFSEHEHYFFLFFSTEQIEFYSFLLFSFSPLFRFSFLKKRCAPYFKKRQKLGLLKSCPKTFPSFCILANPIIRCLSIRV